MSSEATNDEEYVSTVNRLAVRLRRVRKQRGLTQEQVAHEAGIAVFTYSSLERGQSPSGGHANPTYSTLYRVAQVLRLSSFDNT